VVSVSGAIDKNRIVLKIEDMLPYPIKYHAEIEKLVKKYLRRNIVNRK
jgi:hypothetical protein